MNTSEFREASVLLGQEDGRKGLGRMPRGELDFSFLLERNTFFLLVSVQEEAD